MAPEEVQEVAESSDSVVAESRERIGGVQKYWTVENGVLGTAHTSRKNKQVDFRQAGEPTVNFDQTIHGDRITISVNPPSGQEIPPLVLEPTSTLKVVTKQDPESGEQRYYYEVTAQFMGLEIKARSESRSETYDEDLRQAYHSERIRQRDEAKLAKKCKEEERRAWFEARTVDELAEEVNTQEITKLRAGSLSTAHLVEAALSRMASKSQIFINNNDVSRVIERLGENGMAQFKILVLEADNRRREARKQEWLAKQSKK